MEAAHRQGYLTGLVVTTRLTHATPAAFGSHDPYRDDEDIIAEQELFGYHGFNRTIDLMLGGGRCFFVPKSSAGSCRPDDKDLLAQAQAQGWTVQQGRPAFDELDYRSVRLPHLHTFADNHMAFEVDRDPSKEPSLAEMTLKSLRIMDQQLVVQQQAASQAQDSSSSSAPTSATPPPKGFFLMVEGSRIDMAAHGNDPAGHVHDILAYQEAVQVAQKYVDTHPGTILISISDHETGGFSAAHETTPYTSTGYRWRPEALALARRSCESTAMILFQNVTRRDVTAALSSTSSVATARRNVAVLLMQYLGLYPADDVGVAPLPSLPPLPPTNNNNNNNNNNAADDFTNPSFRFTLVDVDNILSMIRSALSPNDADANTQLGKIPFNPSLAGKGLLPLEYELARMLSLAAEVGWSTWGHSAVDVNLYVYGADDYSLVGKGASAGAGGAAGTANEDDGAAASTTATTNNSDFWSPSGDTSVGSDNNPPPAFPELNSGDGMGNPFNGSTDGVVEPPPPSPPPPRAPEDGTFGILRKRFFAENLAYRFPLLNKSFRQGTSGLLLDRGEWWPAYGNATTSPPTRRLTMKRQPVPDFRTIIGNHENTELSQWIVDYLGLDVDRVTREIQS